MLDKKEQELVIDEEVPVSAKLGYGIGNSAHMYLSGIGLGAIDVFYLKVLGADPSLMALSWVLFIVWNMVNDPLIGILQDKTKTDIGRRIPYLRYGSIIYVITFIWIWFPFVNQQQLLFWNHLLMLYVFDTVYSMMGLIFYSLPAEMAVTQKERGKIMVYSTALGALGTVGNIIVPLIFLQGEILNVGAFRITMVISGIAAGLIIYLASFYIQENRYTVMEESLGFFESITETFKNKPFLIAEITIFASAIMTQVIQGYFIFLFDYVVKVVINSVNIIALLILIAILGLSIWWLTSNIEKYGIKRLMFLGGIVSIVGFLVLLVMGVGLGINQKNKMPFIILFGPLAAVVFGYVGFMLLSQPLMGDCIDHDEILTGKRRETTYSGVNALITKPAVSIGRALFLVIMSFFGFQQSPGAGIPAPPPSEQPVSVGTGVIFAFTLIPTLCLTIGLIALYFFPLEGEEWQKKKQEIHKIHQKKRRKYLENLKEEEETS
ncbi:MAG: MFS transporter [Promethearchaeia archaeon]